MQRFCLRLTKLSTKFAFSQSMFLKIRVILMYSEQGTVLLCSRAVLHKLSIVDLFLKIVSKLQVKVRSTCLFTFCTNFIVKQLSKTFCMLRRVHEYLAYSVVLLTTNSQLRVHNILPFLVILTNDDNAVLCWFSPSQIRWN